MEGFIKILYTESPEKDIHSFPDIIDNESIRNIIEEQRRFVSNANIEYEPSILINGRLLSDHYSVNDIVPLIQLLSKL